MKSSKSLRGRRIAVLAVDGFEKVELMVPRKALRSAGADVEIVSLRSGRIRGVNLHEPASRVRVDRIVTEVDAADYDGLLIPGGLINPDLLRQSAEAREFVRSFDRAGKPIATICHGPWVLASAELVRGRTMTSWPGVRDDLVHAGATWLDREVVQDRNWVTSRGPQDMIPFVEAMTNLFAHTGPMPATTQVQHESDPQRRNPPAAMLQTMKWMPRPSIRTALALTAAAGVAMWAANRRSSMLPYGTSPRLPSRKQALGLFSRNRPFGFDSRNRPYAVDSRNRQFGRPYLRPSNAFADALNAFASAASKSRRPQRQMMIQDGSSRGRFVEPRTTSRSHMTTREQLPEVILDDLSASERLALSAQLRTEQLRKDPIVLEVR